MENKLKLETLKIKLDDLKLEVKKDRDYANFIKEKIDELNKCLFDLKKEYKELENKKNIKEKPLIELKPFIFKCLKKSLLYLVYFLTPLLVAIVVNAKLFIIPIISIILAVTGSGVIDFLFISKETRKNIKDINLSDIEKEIEINRNQQAEVIQKTNEYRNTEKEIWKKVAETGSIISSLNNEIRYIEDDINRKNKSDDKQKRLVRRKVPNKR